MATNMGTPRIYVNILEYLSAIGYTDINDVYRLNPTQLKDNIDTDVTSVSLPDGIFTTKGYVAYLGHTGGELAFSNEFSSDIIINAELKESEDSALLPDNTGFSIRSFDGADIEDTLNTSSEDPIGCISVGTYYDMPHAPDMSLSLSYEFDGVKSVQTKGGATLSNASYTKPSDWGNMGAWQLGNADYPNATNFRNGRRVWSLSFSYLSDTDLMPVLGVQNYEDVNTTDILDGTDFFSQVWNRTMGGHLPFIFQVDKDNNNLDQFALCRFDTNSLSLTQINSNLYNISLKIRETW